MSDKKVLCPDSDCNTENEAGAEACSKCGLDLPSFFTLSRVLDIREKNKIKADDEAKKKSESEKPAKRTGLAGLTRRK
jgi:hypothetical protein